MSALSILAAAHEHPSRTAWIDDDGALSWSALAACVQHRLETLRRGGIADGARVAIVGAPTRARCIDVLAAIEGGLPLVLLHPRWTGAERDFVLRSTGAAWLDEVTAAAGTDALDGGLETGADRAPIEDGRTLAIVHTSGTTGTPKGAVLSRRALLASARASAVHLPLGPDDRWLLCMPTAHVGGLSVLVRALVARAGVVACSRFEPDAFFALEGRAEPTRVSLVPTMLSRLLDAGWRGHPALRTVLLGGAACPPRLLQRALDVGLPIRTTYGLTEACSQVTTARRNLAGTGEGAGHPLPGTELRIDARGHVLVRGPTLFDGWFGRPESPLDGEGWYDTGDLGRLDDEGRLHLIGRRSDLVVRAGENVYPAEVEAALDTLEGVLSSCVYGVPDEDLGQAVEAALVVEDARAPTDEQLITALRARLASFKVPRAFARLPEFAVGSSGKTDRGATATRARAWLEARRQSESSPSARR